MIEERCEYKTCRKKATCTTLKRISGYLFRTRTCEHHAEIIYYIDFGDPVNAPINTNTVTYDGRTIDGIE